MPALGLICLTVGEMGDAILPASSVFTMPLCQPELIQFPKTPAPQILSAFTGNKGEVLAGSDWPA